jgi:hypothetical protein
MPKDGELKLCLAFSRTRGFCLESSHLQDPERLSRLMALLTIALCWAFRMGEWLVAQKPIPVKKHGRKAQSIFRYGFDHLRRILLNLEQKMVEFLHALQFLSLYVEQRAGSIDLLLLSRDAWVGGKMNLVLS